MQDYSTELVEIDGRAKTRYDWSQEMRRMETAVRLQKDTATLAKAAGDAQLERRCKGTILQLNEKYKSVADQAGLKPEFQRTFVRGYRDGKRDSLNDSKAIAASRKYVSKKDTLFRLLEFVEPIEGYEDFGGHGKPYYIEIETNLGTTEKYNAKQFADTLREDPGYHGGDIHLLFCNTGEKEDGLKYLLSRQPKRYG